MRSSLLISASIMVLAGGVAAGAQTEPTETIIITAPGPDRAASELIGNATALTREDILQTLEPSLGNSLIDEPGVSSTFFGQASSRPVLRGLGAERVLVLTNGLGVIDASAASPDHQVTTDGIDATRVEILRGPAALAYGGQAIGGVVNVIDGLIAEERTDNTWSGEALAAYHDVAEGEELAGRVTFGTGPLVVALTASSRDFGDYDIPGFAESALMREMEHGDHEDDHGDDHDDHDHEEELDEGTLSNSFVKSDTLGLGASLVGERGFIGIALRNQNGEYGLPGHAHEHGHEEDHDEEHDDDHDHDDDHEHGEEEQAFIDLAQTRADFRAGLNLNLGAFNRLIVAGSISDYEHTEFEAPGEPGTVFGNDGVEGRVELDYDGQAGKGAIGLQFSSTDFSAVGEEAFVTPTERDAVGAFVYHHREWDNGAGLELGGRVEQVSLDNIFQGEREFDLFGASIGFHRHFGDGWFLGAEASLAERAPNESELFADGPHLATRQFEIGDGDLDKERGLNLEGTVRRDLGNGRIGVNVFAARFDDFIYLAPRGDEEDGLPVFVFTQDDADFVGGEAYLDWLVPAGPLGADWTFDAGLDLVSGELSGGGDVPLLPPMTAKLGAKAQWGPLGLKARARLAGEQDEPGAGYLPTDSYALFSLGADYALDLGGPQAVLFADLRNVTDEEARIATSTLKDLAPLPGRNLRLGLRVSF